MRNDIYAEGDSTTSGTIPALQKKFFYYWIQNIIT